MSRLAVAVAALSVTAFAGCSEHAQPLSPQPTAAGATAEAQTFTQNEFLPLSLAVFVSCAAGGAGEVVELQGRLHILTHTTNDGRGGFHLKQHFQPQGVSGVGQVTGDSYRATGVTQVQLHAKAGSTETYVNNFKIIGQGPGNNFLVHENFHVTVNANGRVTTVVDNFSVACK